MDPNIWLSKSRTTSNEHTFSNYVRIRNVVQKTCQRRWTIGRSGERGSGISVLPARHDDDDIHIFMWEKNTQINTHTHIHAHIYIYIYIYMWCVWVCVSVCVCQWIFLCMVRWGVMFIKSIFPIFGFKELIILGCFVIISYVNERFDILK